jgi:KDO2-lipid IV(A) lauroyltransferase
MEWWAMADPAEISFRRWLAYSIEALFAFPVFWLVRLLPMDLASGLGGWLGRKVGPRLGVSRRARNNLRHAFPEKNDAGIEAIVDGMWENLGRTIFEYPHLQRLDIYSGDGRVEVVGVEHIDRMKNDGLPGIFFSGHFANWEVVPQTVAQRGLPLHLIYRAANNPLVQRLFDHRRPDGSELLPKGSEGARRAIKLLRDGEHLGMLVDQKMNDGIPVPFFGRDAMTAPAVAQFALRYGCPVVPIRIERLDGFRFRVTHHEPMVLSEGADRQADILAFMMQINAHLEDWIRQRPEQWLWLHRRWPN